MSKSTKKPLLNPNELLFFKALPREYYTPFDTELIAQKISISERSSRNYHRKFRDLKLVEMGKEQNKWEKKRIKQNE